LEISFLNLHRNDESLRKKEGGLSGFAAQPSLIISLMIRHCEEVRRSNPISCHQLIMPKNLGEPSE
jgi:hypothetical protein